MTGPSDLDLNGFRKRMLALANMVPNFVLTPQMIAMYERLLAPFGWPAVCMALERVMLERSSRDPFPSMKEIAGIIKPQADPEAESVHIAGLILECVRKDGWTNMDRARARMGEMGWRVVGGASGYRQLCESLTERNETTYRAQFREAARSAFKRGPAALPALPEASPKRGAPQLIGLDDLINKAKAHLPKA